MKNSISDLVASSMDSILKSAEHKALFGLKVADSSSKDEMCAKHGVKDDCPANDTKESDTASAKDSEMTDKSDTSYAKDSESEKTTKSHDSSSADDNAAKETSEESKTSTALDVAIDSLLTASAALDSVGMEKSAAYSLKLASLVVEAKKAKKDKKKGKKGDKKGDKKDSKKETSKSSKSDSKSSSKSSKK